MSKEGIGVAATVRATADEARAVVQGFYQWYLGYPGDPLAERAYRDRPELTPFWISQMDEHLNDPGGDRPDPFLCSRERPSYLTVGRVTVVSLHASASVHSSDLAHPLTVRMRWAQGRWLIDEILCVPAGATR